MKMDFKFFFVFIGFAILAQPLCYAPERIAPGVYIEEIESGPKPIEGVEASIPGSVGVTVRGPKKAKPKVALKNTPADKNSNNVFGDDLIVGAPLKTPDTSSIGFDAGPVESGADHDSTCET